MRFFLPVWLIVLLFAADAFGQTELARQQFAHGLTNAASGQFEQALKNFQNALEKYRFASDADDEFAARVNYNVGVCLYRTGRASEAVAYFEAALESSKNRYQKAAHALGVAQTELGNWAAANSALALAVRLDKRDGKSWFDFALARLREKDLNGAAAAFQKAVRFKSADAAAAHNNLGVIAAMGGDWRAAEQQFETAFAMSGGKLKEAVRNLNLCRSQNSGGDLIAELAFTNNRN